MYHQCGLWLDDSHGVLQGSQSLLIDTPVLADDGVGVLGNRDTLWLLRGVQDDDDLLPVVNAFQVFQSEGNHLTGSLQGTPNAGGRGQQCPSGRQDDADAGR